MVSNDNLEKINEHLLSAELLQPPLQPLKTMTLMELLALNVPERELMFGPWLAHRDLSMVYAARGVGKTLFALNLAYAVSTGGFYLGWGAPAPVGVLYVDGEMKTNDLQARMRTIIRADERANVDKERMRFLAFDQIDGPVPDLGTADGQAWLDSVIGDAKLVILDNLATLQRSGNENEREGWTTMQSYLLSLRRRGISVLMVHHAGKSGTQRGSSAREDVLDSVIELQKPDDAAEREGPSFTVRFTKARSFGEHEVRSFVAAMDPSNGVWVRLPAPTATRDSQIMDLARQGLTQRAISTALGVPLSTVNRVIKVGRQGNLFKQGDPSANHNGKPANDNDGDEGDNDDDPPF